MLSYAVKETEGPLLQEIFIILANLTMGSKDTVGLLVRHGGIIWCRKMLEHNLGDELQHNIILALSNIASEGSDYRDNIL